MYHNTSRGKMLVKSLTKGGAVISDFNFRLSIIELSDWYSAGVRACKLISRIDIF